MHAEAQLDLRVPTVQEHRRGRLALGALNARSLYSHIEDVRCDYCLTELDVIGVSETSTIDTDALDHYALDGYDCHFAHGLPLTDNRRPRSGAGVYYCKDKWRVVVDDAPCVQTFSGEWGEIVSIVLASLSEANALHQIHNLRFFSIYRRPSTSVIAFCTALEGALASGTPIMDGVPMTTVVAGDFNICAVEDTVDMRHLGMVMAAQRLTLFSTGAATHDGGRILDHTWSDYLGPAEPLRGEVSICA